MTQELSLPPAFDVLLLDAMPDVVSINQYLEDDDNGNGTYSDDAIVTAANIVIEGALVELRLGHGLRTQSQGADFFIPAPVQIATIIIPANGVKPKDQITFTVDSVEYVRYVAMQTLSRDENGNDWVQSLTVQITKE